MNIAQLQQTKAFMPPFAGPPVEFVTMEAQSVGGTSAAIFQPQPPCPPDSPGTNVFVNTAWTFSQ